MKPSRRKFLAVTGSAAVTSVAGVGSASAATPVSNVPVPDNTSQMYPVMGTDADNPTATVYGNFKCPFTQDFVNNVLPDLVDKYVVEGKLNICFRTISYEPYGRGKTHGTQSNAFISDSDPKISATHLGVWEEDPEAYWKYFESMFAGSLVSGTVTPEKLKPVMEKTGVDNPEEIVARVKKGKYDSLVKDSHESALDLKIEHTPTFEIADSTFVGPKSDEFNDLVSFINANLSKADKLLPKEDSEEVTSGESSGSGSGSATSTITLDGSSAQGWAKYEITVSGEFKQDRSMEASIEDSDVIDGSTASGGVGPWKDTFVYTGKITDLTLTQPIDVLRNEKPLDLEKIGANIKSESKKLDVKPATDSEETTQVKNALSGACSRR
ncbi:DsbA family protein [Halocatena pleomorpha]|uniref:Thioredoxin n=1 Tax=Halocatena pleomorpha TaxID=1785090 RepID=A0A3P3RH16_9EURY|nr:thioredoxin domain-containing protein [Halocatena pleomorpha]RRJ32685.1 thioredoxin [Halocatena pleomorpha]